jgi:hypothetical protein
LIGDFCGSQENAGEKTAKMRFFLTLFLGYHKNLISKKAHVNKNQLQKGIKIYFTLFKGKKPAIVIRSN